MPRLYHTAAIALFSAFAMPVAMCADNPSPPILLKSFSLSRSPVGNAVNSLSYSPDGTMLAVGTHHDIQVWDLKTGKENFSYKYSTGEAKVAFSQDGKSVVVSRYHVVELLDPLTGKIQSKHSKKGVDGHLAFSPDGKTLARGESSRVTLYDFPAMTKSKTLDCESKTHNGTAGVVFSPNGKLVAVGLDEKVARVFNVETGKQLFNLEGHKGGVWSVAFSPDGKTLATGAGDLTESFSPLSGEIKLWDISNGKELVHMKVHPWYVTSLAFSPDGTMIASGSWAVGDYRKGGILLSDAMTLKEVARCEGHGGQTMAVAFSPDGKILASGGTDSKVKLWEIPQKK
jgi:WD40 repeat protein